MQLRAPALLLPVAVVLAASASAQDATQGELTALARGADRVVVATVTRVEPVFQSNEFGDELIVSRTHLRVETILKHSGKPSLDTPTMVVEIEGGTIGELSLAVSDLPRLDAGQRAVMFLRQNGRGVAVPHGRGRGILELDPADRVKGSALTLRAVRQAVERAR